MESQPIERAIPTTDGRCQPEDSNRRASRHQFAVPGTLACSKLYQPAIAGTDRSTIPGATTSAPMPSGPSNHFCEGTP